MKRHAMSRRDPITPAPKSLRWIVPVAIVALVAATHGDVFRLGFFADDFHFLDVARRVRLLDALSGQYGIWPWYRPLSRELFFEVVAAAGPWRTIVAHAANLIALAGCAWLVHRIGGALVGVRAAPIATILFATYGYAKFLASWSSGFQDLLALMLTLLAVDAALGRHRFRAVLCAGLAPFAKESAFLAGPLVVLSWLSTGREPWSWRWIVAQLSVSAIAVAIHVAVRATWHTEGSAVTIERSPLALAGALAQVVGAFVGSMPATLRAWPMVPIGAVAALILLMRRRSAAARVEWPRTTAFLVIATLGALAPLVVGHLLELASPYAYYAFPAVPWLALLVARPLARVPRLAADGALIALVGWNVLSLAYRPPDLSSPSGWSSSPWGWPESMRLSAVSSRFAEDLRRVVGERPESLVVVYREIPRGCFFQTEDGPATRESLEDPGVSAYWINVAPVGLRPERAVVISFDPESRHLERDALSLSERSARAATALASGGASAAWAFTSLCDSTTRTLFEMRYVRSAAALLAGGAPAYVGELHASGLLDSTRGGIASEVAALEMTPELEAGLVRVLRAPLDAEAHAAFANELRMQGADAPAAVELRIATSLAPTRFEDRLGLAQVLQRMGESERARRELEKLIAETRGTVIGAAAQRAIERISASGAPRGD